MILAIIPARIGSKRIKQKNIVNFLNKPMIYWTIKAAKESKIFDYIFVSTDSKKIARISKKYGAKVPFLRSKNISDDKTSVHIVTVHSIKLLQKKLNCKFNTVVQLMPNCPLRTSKDIINAYNVFKKKKYKFLISSAKFFMTNPWWAFKVLKNDIAQMIFPYNWKKRSQKLKELYAPSGAIWIANVKYLLKEKTFYGKGFRVFKLDIKSAVDIDDVNDLNLAKVISKL
jgi:N-acylneuraminate cytidylyltransferase